MCVCSALSGVRESVCVCAQSVVVVVVQVRADHERIVSSYSSTASAPGVFSPALTRCLCSDLKSRVTHTEGSDTLQSFFRRS